MSAHSFEHYEPVWEDQRADDVQVRARCHGGDQRRMPNAPVYESVVTEEDKDRSLQRIGIMNKGSPKHLATLETLLP